MSHHFCAPAFCKKKNEGRVRESSGQKIQAFFCSTGLCNSTAVSTVWFGAHSSITAPHLFYTSHFTVKQMILTRVTITTTPVQIQNFSTYDDTALKKLFSSVPVFSGAKFRINKFGPLQMLAAI